MQGARASVGALPFAPALRWELNTKDTRTMVKQDVPPRGSFDYLLKGIPPPDNYYPPPPPPAPVQTGGPDVVLPRVTVNIEITDAKRQAEPRKGHAWVWLVWLVLITALMMGCAHAQDRWRGVGRDDTVRGQSWQQPDGTTRTDWRFHDGTVKTCTIRQLDDRIYTECQ